MGNFWSSTKEGEDQALLARPGEDHLAINPDAEADSDPNGPDSWSKHWLIKYTIMGRTAVYGLQLRQNWMLGLFMVLRLFVFCLPWAYYDQQSDLVRWFFRNMLFEKRSQIPDFADDSWPTQEELVELHIAALVVASLMLGDLICIVLVLCHGIIALYFKDRFGRPFWHGSSRRKLLHTLQHNRILITCALLFGIVQFAMICCYLDASYDGGNTNWEGLVKRLKKPLKTNSNYWSYDGMSVHSARLTTFCLVYAGMAVVWFFWVWVFWAIGKLIHRRKIKQAFKGKAFRWSIGLHAVALLIVIVFAFSPEMTGSPLSLWDRFDWVTDPPKIVHCRPSGAKDSLWPLDKYLNAQAERFLHDKKIRCEYDDNGYDKFVNFDFSADAEGMGGWWYYMIYIPLVFGLLLHFVSFLAFMFVGIYWFSRPVNPFLRGADYYDPGVYGDSAGPDL